jgi:hypothetical protein
LSKLLKKSASMDIQHFIGVDISKATLDWAVYSTKGGIIYQSQSANSEVAIKATMKTINSLPDFEITKSVCCMEHTGIVRHEVARFEYG